MVEFARQRGADLIVMGVRSAAGRIGAATHLERATAHRIARTRHAQSSPCVASERTGLDQCILARR